MTTTNQQQAEWLRQAAQEAARQAQAAAPGASVTINITYEDNRQDNRQVTIVNQQHPARYEQPAAALCTPSRRRLTYHPNDPGNIAGDAYNPNRPFTAAELREIRSFGGW